MFGQQDILLCFSKAKIKTELFSSKSKLIQDQSDQLRLNSKFQEHQLLQKRCFKDTLKPIPGENSNNVLCLYPEGIFYQRLHSHPDIDLQSPTVYSRVNTDETPITSDTPFNFQSYRLFYKLSCICQSVSLNCAKILTIHPEKQLTNKNMQQCFSNQLIKKFKNQVIFIYFITRYTFHSCLKYPNIFI